MMFRNRVDPFGQLIKTKARGVWLGNRGVIHNAQQEIVRPFKLKAWITCVLEFKGRHREIMQPDRWTELFFVDEATALAAGHRPCFECRRADADRFKHYWLLGNPEYGFDKKTSIKRIDEVLHGERINNGSKVKYKAKLKDLPYGTFIELNGEAYLLRDNLMYKWAPEGYGKGGKMTGLKEVDVLTPKSMVRMLDVGYIINWSEPCCLD